MIDAQRSRLLDKTNLAFRAMVALVAALAVALIACYAGSFEAVRIAASAGPVVEDFFYGDTLVRRTTTDSLLRRTTRLRTTISGLSLDLMGQPAFQRSPLRDRVFQAQKSEPNEFGWLKGHQSRFMRDDGAVLVIRTFGTVFAPARTFAWVEKSGDVKYISPTSTVRNCRIPFSEELFGKSVYINVIRWVVYLAVCFAAWFGITESMKAYVSSRRLRNRQCPACEYPQIGEACPECGRRYR